MATKITPKELEKIRNLIQQFDFKTLFNQLGWSKPSDNQHHTVTVNSQVLSYQHIAQLSGVVVLQITAIPDSKTRLALHEDISRIHHEHLLIFVDANNTQTCWSWLKRDGKKSQPRSHSYFKGQTGDLLLSKIINMMVDFKEFDENGLMPIVEVTEKLRNALDIEPITKKFFKDFQNKHIAFVEEITGINNEKKRAWYASVLLHRLMFIWFLQKKNFLDKGNGNYLPDKLAQIQATLVVDGYYSQFLKPLFFQGFAKPEQERSNETNQLLGNIRYLNGGLFLEHSIEIDYPNIQVSDKAFSDLFALFNAYSWNLNDTLDGNDDEINPDVLGYIFEKYINQKAFGAYYTRSEITDYLCERTICQLILDRVNQPAIPELNEPAGRQFKDINDLLFNCDADLCYQLLTTDLPSISLLDPACGSGAFLVAAMKTLIAIYQALIAKADSYHNHSALNQWLNKVKKHPSVDYFIKKQIITYNLYGVDIMPEATEIAKLRLFLALVSSAQTVDELEPLPNIDFNIMAGNSLIGLLTVEGEKFNEFGKTGDLFRDMEAQTYTQILQDKNRLIANYKDASSYTKDLTLLRRNISDIKDKAYSKLNKLLLSEFERLQIKYEQATWDEVKNKEGKAIKRALNLEDIKALNPFHWGYEFDAIFARGGFDAIITNPPWENFEPNGKEFFREHDSSFLKNKMTIKDYENQVRELLKNEEIKESWLNYHSGYNHQRIFFRTATQYKNQVPIVNGKRQGKDVNLYKLFTEQCFNLLKENGECGIVIPNGIYQDLGATDLRKLLFNETNITGLFCFENNKLIFEGVHRSFKFVVLTFVKTTVRPELVEGSCSTSAQQTDLINQSFPAAFMRHDVNELTNFPNENSLKISTDLIKKSSPDSLSVMEFKSDIDVIIVEKMLEFPLLGKQIENTWTLEIHREFNLTDDAALFHIDKKEKSLQLYEGKMIHQFEHKFGNPRYWIDEEEGRKAILGRQKESSQLLDYQGYRLGFREVAASTNQRTMIATLLPRNIFTCYTVTTSSQPLDVCELLLIVAFLNSFVVDFIVRQKVTCHCTMYLIYQLPIPRLTETDPQFKPIVERAAALICTTPEFDDLKTELLESKIMILDSDKSQLRAELDAIIAHLYGLTETEFAHILQTFPIVKEDIKVAAMAEFKKLAVGEKS